MTKVDGTMVRVAANGRAFTCSVEPYRTRNGEARWTVTLAGHKTATLYTTREAACAYVATVGSPAVAS